MARHSPFWMTGCWRTFGWLAPLAIWTGGALAAPGFDCKLAHSPVEQLICSDTTLANLDRGVAARYQRLSHAASPEGAALLLKRQRAWLASRADCLGGLNAGERAWQIECLTKAYQEPSTALEAQFRQADGLMLEERRSVRHIARLRVTEDDNHPWLTGRPAPRAAEFNRYVSGRLNLRKGMFAAAPIELDAKPEGKTEYDRFYEIHHLDGKLISIEMFTHHESYFGHGWREEFALNWDLKQSRPIKVADLFRPDLDWREVVMDHVRNWPREDGSFNDPEDIANLAQPDDDEGWLFDDDSAVLLIGRGERSMVGTSADVPVPYDVLAPLLRPDGPLPAINSH
jgi:uncharacterized protein